MNPNPQTPDTLTATLELAGRILHHALYYFGRHFKRHPATMIPSVLFVAYVLIGGKLVDLKALPHHFSVLWTRWHHEPKAVWIIVGVIALVHLIWATWEETRHVPSSPSALQNAFKQANLWDNPRYQTPQVIKKVDHDHRLELVVTPTVPPAIWQSEAVMYPFCGALSVKQFDRVFSDDRGNVHLVMSHDVFPQKPLTQKERLKTPSRHLALGYLSHGLLTLSYDDRPHWLIAGSTGSGKSVLVGHLLTQILAHRMPITLIDPKGGIDYGEWEDLLAAPIATNVEEAMPHVQALWDLHLSRRDQLKAWHMKSWAQAQERGKTTDPDVWLVIDEYAIFSSDSKDKAKKELAQQAQTLIQNLAMGARATGIHLLIVTQYPTCELLGNQLRQQLTPIAGRLETDTASRTVLGEPGAEQLPGKGRFLIRQLEGLVEFQGFLP